MGHRNLIYTQIQSNQISEDECLRLVTFHSIEANCPSGPVSCGVAEERKRGKISGKDGGETSGADKVAMLHLP